MTEPSSRTLDYYLAPLHEAALRRDSTDVVCALRQLAQKYPDSWTEILVHACGVWGDDATFVMGHVVIRDGNVVTFERVDRGSA